ncbi:MAG: magnesium/cobalt transporter CorA [Gammaproteobacteria bacterium]
MKSYAKKIGLAPGALIHIGEKKSAQTTISTLDCHKGIFRKEIPLSEVIELKKSDSLHWIKVTGLSDIKTIESIGNAFKIHNLVLEDILHTTQRPKAQFFDDYVFIVLRMISYQPEPSRLESEQISIILGPNYVITFQEADPDDLHPLVERIEKAKGLQHQTRSDFLAYSIMDLIIDHYYLVLENVGEISESIELNVLENKGLRITSEIHELKRDLLHLRKAIWPLREAISTLIRDKHKLIDDKLRPFLHDLYDHTTQVIDNAEIARDMISGILEIYLSAISYRMNEVMKTLTIISTIFIPLTFIVGVYGMNFDYMPELKWPWGYYAIWGVMAALGLSMLLYFKIKKWF